MTSKTKVKNLISKINPRSFISDYLIALGVQESEIEDYICPVNVAYQSPWDYPNMKLACEMVKQIISNPESSIGILVDSDLDGCMSATAIVQFLKSNSVNPKIFFHPNKGHGLTASNIDEIENANLNLLIAPDAGSNDVQYCSRLASHGTKILILDHHEITKPNPSAVIINPHMDKAHLNTKLSGAGVASKFVDAYCEMYGLNPVYTKDLVACSIISDVCDVTVLENRKYIYDGLNQIENPFLKFLFDKANEATPHAVGWTIAPKINALFRVESDIAKVFQGFIDESAIESAYKECNRAYNASKKITNEITKDPVIEEHKNCAISFVENENASFTGLLANRFLDATKKPTFVLRNKDDKVYTGSMRSPIEFASILNSSRLCRAEGHEKACGLIIQKENYEAFLKWLDAQNFDLEPTEDIAGQLSPRNINLFLCEEIEANKQLWANQIPEPRFSTTLRVKNSDVALFKKKSTTFKVEKNGVSFIKFQLKEDEVQKIESTKQLKIDVIFTLGINQYNGAETPQGMIQEWTIDEDDGEDMF